MSAEAHRREAWVELTCALLGAWLLASPAAMGYGGAMAWSDYVAGALVLVVSVWALRSARFMWGRWILALLGVWVLHAPLFFWTPSAAAYLNGTVVGIALIAFSVLVPRQTWAREPVAPDLPAGWSFNPSSWPQRTPIIALAWINFLLARYLAAYQLDHIAWPWDPFFGDGTQRVLDSDISEAFPISDAGLGATAYIIEALAGYMGAASRWRTAPWTVALFGVLVVPVGVVSTVLMILQPVAVGAWCTICLVAAALMIVMAALAVPEVVAMVDYLVRTRRAGRSVWRTFWLGGPDEQGGVDERRGVTFDAPWRSVYRAMVQGTTWAWTLVVGALLGVWFVAAPDVMGIESPASDVHVVAGALVIVIAILAIAEVMRTLRLVNIVVGVALAVAVWLLDGAPLLAQVLTTLLVLVLVALSVTRGPLHERHGQWQRYIR